MTSAIIPQTLLQFTTTIGNAIRMCPELRGAWVTAEMSDLRVAGGHCYMELVEKDQRGVTVAKMRAIIWSNMLGPLRQKFFAVTGRDICNGLKVMVLVAANFHPQYGLSATISDIDPSYTLGDIERLRREILEKLKSEGILDRNRQLPLAMNPQRIAVISSDTAAGYGDFMNQLNSNASGLMFYPYLFSAVMQGDRTSLSVRQALERIEMTIDLWDCVVIIRGGGATTDMTGFDDYELARAVALFPLPVIVGIGHERDRCVLDEIACVRCKTPTAVAAFLIDRLNQAWASADRLCRAIAQFATDRLAGEQRRIAQDSVELPSAVNLRMERERQRLSRITESLPLSISRLTGNARGRLDANLQLISAASANAIARGCENLARLTQRLSDAAAFCVEANNRRLEHAGNLIKAYDPQNTLRRGYSVTRLNGKAVTDPGQVSPGDMLETRLANGSIISTAK